MILKECHIKLHKAISKRGIGKICNDLLRDEIDLLTKDEWIEFCGEYHKWNGDPEEFDPKRPIMMDFMVMDFINYLMYKNINP